MPRVDQGAKHVGVQPLVPRRLPIESYVDKSMEKTVNEYAA